MQKNQTAYYRTLGVNREATQEEISKAYRTLAMKLHPDRPGGSMEKFQLLQRAYEVLGNEFSRSNYDAELQRRKSKRIGFKRPPDLDGVLMPVYYKLANGDLYTFETAVSQMGCTFRHGDIISFGEKMGCFVGLAGDDFYYWRREGSNHATKLCQRGSFGVGSVNLVMRANLQNYNISQLRTLADAPLGRYRPTSPGPTTKAATPKAADCSTTRTNKWATTTPRKGDLRSECELARLAITRQVEQRRFEKNVRALLKKEREARECIDEVCKATMEDCRVEFEEALKQKIVTAKTRRS
ncbi:chaperone protein DNAj, putative [Trypanosoma brucei gambiense DAL972]|uniref:Chaperone protein DNAj, putative n=2 Tax=Trypanosoma brucei TaxID=5691 RepID=C9ZQY3_TRYB9|nr:chaperone protein DNAj, putative [Trypanosoma brucei gambiense DAL972]RHW71842.1 chaperone protein DNAj [Trypanosoma brucei equiperdum]CBH11813.1 chaperone protein DNAj, putative [Trypanosoma brucei gambiense DAL972]|eukprot:XP_011774098.1 chaperone protein DNAj, putative [Trypanosoma brucei gambiense DAL972]